MRHIILASTLLLTLGPAALWAADNSQPMPATGSPTAPAAENPSQSSDTAGTATSSAVSDSWITAKTKLSLLGDENTSATSVHVTTKNGVVTLRGKVNNDAAKKAAEDDASKIDGVRHVVNHLVVVPKSAEKMVERKDDQIVSDVKAQMKKDSHLKSASIDVTSDNGIVTLSGTAPNLSESLRASESARRVSGVRAVHNELHVANEEAG